MRFAYADPPYLGCARKFYGDHPEHAVYDTVDGHRQLIERLSDEYPDGWAYSLTTTSLHALLPLCPSDVRIGGWFKPFASFKPGVNPAYCWGPVILRGGRRLGRGVPTVRDYTLDESPAIGANITLRRGLAGAKPEKFSRWLFDVLGMQPSDEFHDLFPGSGAVTSAWETWRAERAA